MSGFPRYSSKQRGFQGPSVAPAPASQVTQQVQSTVFRAFQGSITSKSNPEPIPSLGFGLFDQAGNMVERYAEASKLFWVAILEALGCDIPQAIENPNHTQAMLISVAGGVVPVVGAQVTSKTGTVEAGVWKMGLVPNAMLSVLKLPEVQQSILVWVQTGMWACTAKLGDKTFPIPEVAGGGALSSNDPTLLLGHI